GPLCKSRLSRGPLGSELPRRCRLGALAAGGAPLCPGRTARTFSVIAFYLVRFAYSSTLCGLLPALSVSRLRHAPGGNDFCAQSRDRNSFSLVSPWGQN